MKIIAHMSIGYCKATFAFDDADSAIRFMESACEHLEKDSEDNDRFNVYIEIRHNDPKEAEDDE